MCLILFSYKTHPHYPLVLAANRDEFYARPTATAHFWKDAPSILAGRDLRGGGTWLGVDRHGRFAAVSNYREPGSNKSDRLSRGLLVSDFLQGQQAPKEYMHQLHRRGQQYHGFNLLVGDCSELWYYSNRAHAAQILEPGLYGISNHLLDTPWPKVKRGKEQLGDRLAQNGTLTAETIFAILSDRTLANDDELPDTGVGLEVERIVSPIFIASPYYGTRSSTVLLIDKDECLSFSEHSFEPASNRARTVYYRFKIEAERGNRQGITLSPGL
jgi:uncharacterized protein with NRDE domain